MLVTDSQWRFFAWTKRPAERPVNAMGAEPGYAVSPSGLVYIVAISSYWHGMARDRDQYLNMQSCIYMSPERLLRDGFVEVAGLEDISRVAISWSGQLILLPLPTEPANVSS